MGDEVGGLSTSLGLFASPLLILSTESAVVMEWKGMSTVIAMWAALPVWTLRRADASPKRAESALSGPMSSD